MPDKEKSYTIGAQIAEVDREIGMRQHVYGRRVKDKKMSQEEADHKIKLMREIKESLWRLEGLEK